MFFVDNVHLYTTGIRVARFTSIDPGVAWHGFLDHQTTRRLGSFFRDEADTTARRIEIDNFRVMTPSHRRGWLRSVLYDTRQVDSTALIDEEIRPSDYNGYRLDYREIYGVADGRGR